MLSWPFSSFLQVCSTVGYFRLSVFNVVRAWHSFGPAGASTIRLKPVSLHLVLFSFLRRPFRVPPDTQAESICHLASTSGFAGALRLVK